MAIFRPVWLVLWLLLFSAVGCPADTMVEPDVPTLAEQLVFRPSRLDFGFQRVRTSVEREVMLVNTGGTSVRLASVDLMGESAIVLSLSECAVGTTLEPEQACSLTLAYAPTDFGNPSGEVSVGTEVSDAKYVLPFRASAIPVCVPAAREVSP